jgi:amphi-Trp domain-containing protein
MSPEYESELTGSRAEIAAVLSGVVDGLLAGSIRLGDGSDAVTVGAPDDIELEIELESEDDGTSLELELEWDEATVTVEERPAAGDEEVPAEMDEDVPVATDEAGTAETDKDVPAETDDLTAHAGAADASQSLARFEVFRDRGDEWRWRLRHRSGNIIATSGEGYTRKHNAWKGLRSVVRNAPGAELTEASGTE